METRTLPANKLPHLSGTIKDAINFGLWFLYEIDYPENIYAKYALATTTRGEFLLTQDGDIISPLPNDIDKNIYKCKILFDGIPSAPVINMPSI